MNHGAITDTDASLLEQSLNRVSTRFQELNLAEIGINRCETTRGIIEHMKTKSLNFTLYGIDSARIHNGDKSKFNFPTEHFVFIEGDSTEVHHLCPELHFLFIDACHCCNHTMLDFLNFSSHIPVGGEVCFHDTSPHVQGKYYQTHGPKSPDFHFAVRTAIKRLGLYNRNDWKFVEEGWDANNTRGGVTVFERTS